MFTFKLPDVGEGIHEAIIANWLVKPGQQVALDEPLVEIETDKALVQIPSPVAGVIAELSAEQGSTVNVGDVIVVIQSEHEQQTLPHPTPAVRPTAQRVLASPAVRKRALQIGIDLRQIKGSAAAGRVTMEDLEKYQPQASKPVQPKSVSTLKKGLSQVEAVEYIPLQGLRKRISERMSEAWQMPHVTSFEEVNVKRLAKLRQRINLTLQNTEERLSYLPFIIKATTRVLQENPYFNASLDSQEQRIVRYRDIHLGIATAIDEGLVVPVIRHIEQLSIIDIQRELNRLTSLARSRKLSPEELTGSTFTITNFGSLGSGGGLGTPIINPPESAILGCGRIEEQPVVQKSKLKKSKLKIRPVLPLALSFDHRLHDGAGAAQFLGRLKTLLTDPAQLLLHLK